MKCSFCGNEMVPGVGKMFVKKDATIYYFCSSKCEKNLVKLRRGRRKTRWTARYHEMKAAKLAAGKEKRAVKEEKKGAGGEKKGVKKYVGKAEKTGKKKAGRNAKAKKGKSKKGKAKKGKK